MDGVEFDECYPYSGTAPVGLGPGDGLHQLVVPPPPAGAAGGGGCGGSTSFVI